jgi:osmotically-inducible protein OsmY
MLIRIIFFISVFLCTLVSADPVFTRLTKGIEDQDRSIETLSLSAINSLDPVLASTVSVNSFNRQILLTGQVADLSKRSAIEVQLARSVPGIKSIVNEISVTSGLFSSPAKNSDSDQALEKNINNLFASEFNSQSLSIVKPVISHGAVYLLGLATQDEVKQITDLARRVQGVKKVVRVFEYRTLSELALVEREKSTGVQITTNDNLSNAANRKNNPDEQQPVLAGMGKRVALVIGNSNYRTHPLRNPLNDANDVSSALKSSGFQVIDLRDASLQQMRAGVRQFGDRLISNDVGLVYYSGHGIEVKGRNYFIPVNADIQREDEIADQGLDVSLVLEKMSTAGKGVNILIVDACRDDPFGRSFRSSSRGLANMDAPRGTIIAYATSPGKVAQDGDGRNSPYTKNLVRAMQQPNKPIEQVFKEVRRAVQEETKNQQTPWENTSLSGDFYFRVQR